MDKQKLIQCMKEQTHYTYNRTTLILLLKFSQFFLHIQILLLSLTQVSFISFAISEQPYDTQTFSVSF